MHVCIGALASRRIQRVLLTGLDMHLTGSHAFGCMGLSARKRSKTHHSRRTTRTIPCAGSFGCWDRKKKFLKGAFCTSRGLCKRCLGVRQDTLRLPPYKPSRSMTNYWRCPRLSLSFLWLQLLSGQIHVQIASWKVEVCYLATGSAKKADALLKPNSCIPGNRHFGPSAYACKSAGPWLRGMACKL